VSTSVRVELEGSVDEGRAPVDSGIPSDGSNAATNELPRGFVAHLTLATPRATLVYWIGVTLVALSVFVPKLLPCVDYPQHLALADIARRLADPAAPEHHTHYINYFTYNGLFHMLVAKLGRVMPIEIAGKIVVSLSLALLGGATIALIRVLRRPPSHAALFTPLLFSFALGWGFVNYALGTAIAVTTLVFVARCLVRPSTSSYVLALLFGVLCAMTHVLAMLLLCLFAAALAPELAFRSIPREGPLGRRLGRTFRRMVLALSPILGGAAWCIIVYRIQYKWDPHMYKDATLEGTSPPVWQKLAYFGSWATGLHSDMTDQLLVCASIGVVLFGMILALKSRRGEEHSDSPPLVLPLVAVLGAFLLTPMVFIGTHLIFPRLAQGVVLAGIVAAPRFPTRFRKKLTTLSLAIGAIAGVNLFVHSVLFARESNDASRVLDDLPPGRRAAAVIYGADTFSFRNGSLIHWAAYYGARRGGDWAYSFARFLSVPVRFKPGQGPWWPKKGWEFAPQDYNVRCKYARNFDLLLVKAPHDVDAEPEVRRILFGQDASLPKLLSHHGEYWAFDTKGVPEDGTF